MQFQTLQIYTALGSVCENWAGRLLLGLGLHEAGRALALALTARGGAGLFLEDNTVQLRTAQREGCCTFHVTTLDEAVRALKNEVRQGRAISVALSGRPALWLADAAERGLQPQMLASTRLLGDEEVVACEALQQRGAQALSGLGLIHLNDAFDLRDALTTAEQAGWQVTTDLASSIVERRERDRQLLVSAREIPGENAMTRAALQWLQVAPSLFPGTVERAYLRSPTAS